MATSSLTPDDPRFTLGLVNDVTRVLEAHGYRLPEGTSGRHAALGRTMTALLTLTRTFEGRDLNREALPHTPEREAEPHTGTTDGR